MLKQVPMNEKEIAKRQKQLAKLRRDDPNFLEKANQWLKDSKLISSVGGVIAPIATEALTPILGPASGAVVGGIQKGVSSLGYGSLPSSAKSAQYGYRKDGKPKKKPGRKKKSSRK